MFQKAIDILKTRWPEVMLVVVLQAAMMLLLEEVLKIYEKAGPTGPTLTFGADFLLGLGLVACGIVWQMIYLGFLKTAADSGTTPQQPMELLRTGRAYFWRIFIFQILLGLAMMLINGIIVTVLASLAFKDRPPEQIPDWFIQACALLGVLIVLKPMLLIPARILVYENSAFEAFFYLRFYRLNGIGGLLPVTIVGFAAILLSTLPMALVKSSQNAYYLVSGFHHAVFSGIVLVLTLIAVLWVQQQYEIEYAQANEDIE